MKTDTSLPLLIPTWPAPKNVRAYTSLRYPGNSMGQYAAFNMAMHVGDTSHDVLINRADFMSYAQLPQEPKWLHQTHSDIAWSAEMISTERPPIGDASFTSQKDTVCVVMTADCLPILVSNNKGTEVAAIHAGWQGLAKGVVESTLSQLNSAAESLLIWIGPSIQQSYYEVGEDVYAEFARCHSGAEMRAAFLTQKHQKWLANVPLLAVQRLVRCGVLLKNIYLSNECTYANPDKYYSYRRDGMTGRMASAIFISA